MSIKKKLYIRKYRKKIEEIIRILQTSSDAKDLETVKILSTTEWNEFSVHSWLIKLINERVEKDYRNPVSIQVYSIIMGLSPADVKDLIRSFTPGAE